MTAIALHDQDAVSGVFERLLHDRSEPTGLTARRRDALARFQRLPFPHRRQEAWRFTDPSLLQELRLEHLPPGPPVLDAGRLPRALTPHRLVFVDGRFVAGLSVLPEQGRVMVGSLAGMWRDEAQRAILESYLDNLPGLEDQPFLALNSALHADGVYVRLRRGAVLETPLEILHVATGEDRASYPRHLLVLEDNAEARVVEHYVGEGRYLCAPVTEIRLGANAMLDHYRYQAESMEAGHLGALRLYLSAHANASTTLLGGGAKLHRTEVAAHLAGQGAHAELRGLALTRDRQLSDYHVRVEHEVPHCTSNQLFKSVLDDQSRVVFDGTIKVHRDAQKTDAQQSSSNLLLSRRAQAQSNPRLEIHADDVSCSHGSTTGFLDKDALFYLRARGIGEAEARAMLVYAFAHEIVDNTRLETLQARLEALLRERLTLAQEDLA